MPSKTPTAPQPTAPNASQAKPSRKKPARQRAENDKRPTGPNTIVEANHTKDERRGNE